MIAIIIFFIAIVTCFGMLAWKAWEIRTSRVAIEENSKIVLPDVPFRHVEKNMLYLAKHIIQSLLLVIVKYWFISTTKTKKSLKQFLKYSYPLRFSYHKGSLKHREVKHF